MAQFSLIGVWVETPAGVSRLWSTANLAAAAGAPSAVEMARSHALSRVAQGAASASVRAFNLAPYGEAEPCEVLEIVDFRDLPGYVEPE